MNRGVISKIFDFLGSLEPDEQAVFKQHVDDDDFAPPLDLFAQNKAELKACLGLFSKIAAFRAALSASSQSAPPVQPANSANPVDPAAVAAN